MEIQIHQSFDKFLEVLLLSCIRESVHLRSSSREIHEVDHLRRRLLFTSSQWRENHRYFSRWQPFQQKEELALEDSEKVFFLLEKIESDRLKME